MALGCCSALELGADQRAKALLFIDSEGSTEDAEQLAGPATRAGPRTLLSIT